MMGYMTVDAPLKSIKENKISELSEIKVDEKTRYWAKIALERMFEI